MNSNRCPSKFLHNFFHVVKVILGLSFNPNTKEFARNLLDFSEIQITNYALDSWLLIENNHCFYTVTRWVIPRVSLLSSLF